LDATVYACSRSIYALKVLRVHCQPASSLHLVPGKSTAAKVHYRAPVWQGLASSVDRARINKSVLDRMRAIGYTCLKIYASATEKGFKAEMTLLRAIINCPNHAMRSTFPPIVVRWSRLKPSTTWPAIAS